MTEQTRFTTPKGIASFPHLFKPNTFNAKEKYEMSLLVSDPESLKVLKAAVIAAAKEKWGKHPKELKNFQSPFKDGNDKYEQDEAKYAVYEDKTVLTARSEYQPGLVDQKKEEIIDEEDFYAGCEARMSVNLYPWEFQNKKGVGLGLVAVQKTGDGERIGGGKTNASDLFDEVEDAGEATGNGFDDYDV